MKILIVGWYGTETIGDRAILAGLAQIFTKVYGRVELVLGSLHPFFSERTIKEDFDTIIKTSYADVEFSIVDTKNSRTLKEAILNTDLLVMGGGPLMDLRELYMIEYAFKLAKKNSKKTAVLGSGIGPLFNKKYKKIVLSILKNSDVTVLRDQASFNILGEIFDDFSEDKSLLSNIGIAFDPAVHYAHSIQMKLDGKLEDYISVNLRAFPLGYSMGLSHVKINQRLEHIIDQLSYLFEDREIRLIPMHYFEVGDDDRYFLNEIKFSLDKKNIFVQNRPLSLEETIVAFKHSRLNFGMRFHSVVLQTIVSGRNYILDYTQPKVGKIAGFLNNIDLDGFYIDRCISLQQSTEKEVDLTKFLFRNEMPFVYDVELINKSFNEYGNALNLLKI